MKIFLTSEISFDFFKQVCKKYNENFCTVQNYFKVFNMCAKIVVISYLVCENLVKFFTNIEIDSTFLSYYDKIFFENIY